MSEETNKPTNGEQKEPENVIILKLEQKPWKLHIDGQVESTDLAIAMLEGALREMETEWRIARGIAAQMKLKQAQDDQQRVDGILKGISINKKIIS